MKAHKLIKMIERKEVKAVQEIAQELSFTLDLSSRRKGSFWCFGISLVVAYLIFRLNKHAARINTIPQSTQHYASLRRLYDILSEILNALKVFKENNIQTPSSSWGMKRIFKKINHFAESVGQIAAGIKQNLDALDADHLKDGTFTFSPEAELWKSRTKAYDYLA